MLVPLEDQLALIPGEEKEHREVRMEKNYGHRLDACAHGVCYTGELRQGIEVRVGEHACRSFRVLARASRSFSNGSDLALFSSHGGQLEEKGCVEGVSRPGFQIQ